MSKDLGQFQFLWFACLWVAICILLSIAGGWFILARQFRATSPTAGQRFRFASGSIGAAVFPVHYRNCLFVTVDERGFRVAVFVLFRFLSPPLYIPWSAVESVSPKALLFVKYHSVRLRRGWPTINIRGDAGQAIFSSYQRALRVAAAR